MKRKADIVTEIDMLFALVSVWRLRAAVLTGQAHRQDRKHNAIRLTAMATGLETAATDLLFQAQRMRDTSRGGKPSTPLRERPLTTRRAAFRKGILRKAAAGRGSK